MNGYYKVGDVVLKNWTLTRLLGQNAAGAVYEATQSDSGQTIRSAIKIITIPQYLNDIKNIMSDGMDRNGVIEYFRGSIGDLLEEFLLLTELQGCSNIVHYDEHIVQQHTEGVGWDIILRMEYLTPLLEYAHSKPLRRDNILQLGIDICTALEHCAEHSIVHRDIKPGNIFTSGEGEFLLGDFGIARALDKTAGGLAKNAYTAPELYRGEQYDETVDIYSLGIVLYRLLNMNRTPFMPDYPVPVTHDAREQALSKQLQGVKFPPPKNADSNLAKVVLKACAFKPEDRYATATRMREDLEAVLAGREVVASTIPSSISTSPSSAPVPTPARPSAVFDYDEPESSGFYQILKDKSIGRSSESPSSSFDDDEPFLDTTSSPFSARETAYREPVNQDTGPIDLQKPRQFDFEEELYDDGDIGGGNEFITTAVEFLKERLIYVGIVGVAILAIIIAILVLNPFGEGEPDPIVPDYDPDDGIEEPVVQYIPIPDFTNMTLVELLMDARFIDVFMFVPDEAYSEDVPEGYVISQNPQAHTSQPRSPLGERLRVTVVVSLGAEPSPFDAITSIEVRYGANPLLGRAAGNPGFTLSLARESSIVLTCRIEPADWLSAFEGALPPPPDGDEDEVDENGYENGDVNVPMEGFVEWISTNEDIFVITSVNPADNSARITATGTGSALLIVRVGDHEDRVIVTVVR